MGAGIFLLKKFYTTIVFSKSTGYFQKGKKSQIKNLIIKEDAHTFKLSSIKALQILPERISSDDSSYTSYEINLVFEDGTRYNVIDHGHRKSIEQDAMIISDFLNVPVWNKMTSTTYFSNNSETASLYDSLSSDTITTQNSIEHGDSVSATRIHNTIKSEELYQDYDSTKPREL